MNAIPISPAFPATPPGHPRPPTPTSGETRMSVGEFLERYADEPRAELVRGVVRMQPMTSFRHGKVCARLTRLLTTFIEDTDVGHAVSHDTRVRVGPDDLRGGDFLYFSYERLAKGESPVSVPDVSPDLVAEVKSPSDTWSEVFVKVSEYVAAGVRAVVVLDPESATASVYRAGVSQEILCVGDTLALPDVLPGFAVPVARLFPA